MLNHSCFPNAIYQMKGNRLMLTALRDIEAGAEVNASYLNVDWPTEERQERIKANWLFKCQCKACSDPTDFETERFNLKYICTNYGNGCPGLLFPVRAENSFGITGRKCFICNRVFSV